MPDKKDDLTDAFLYTDTSVAGGYPKTDYPPYRSPEEKTLKPADHFLTEQESIRTGQDNFYVPDASNHFIRDVNDPALAQYPTYHKLVKGDGSVENVPDFAGSATNINPLNDPVKQEILDTDLSTYHKSHGDGKISPLLPFTSADPSIAHKSIMFTYNRTKTPVADIEWRKGFRHIFFTRPECYIMCNDNGIRLCSQAENDEEFSSAYTRLPHVVQMLAPFYVTGSFENDNKSGGLLSNWHYLLSNRIDGFTPPSGTTIGINENTGKSTRGYTVTPSTFINSDLGGTFEATFNETRELECYESLRLWMYYMAKRHSGMFSPSFNGYQYENNFYSPGMIVGQGKILHPYDRAIDYAATLFDIITNESGTKILYWCKYYGIYPVAASHSMSNSNNGPILNVKTTASFRYMFKLENSNKSLLEFNYNAGVVGKTGKLTAVAQESLPFLIADTQDDKYLGAAGMFTGSPYIVMGPDSHTNLLSGANLVVPYLRFANLDNMAVNKVMNQNIVNDTSGIDLNPISL